MSAFVMSEKFFDQLAAELYAHATLRRSRLQWAVEHVLGLRDVPENRYEQRLREFAQECYGLNVAAVNGHYNENYEASMIRFAAASGVAKWSDEQLVKHLECLSYQCAEGSCPQTETYQTLERLIGQLARGIVGKSQAYELAKWDYAA